MNRSLINKITMLSNEFFEKNQWRLLSIILGGSLSKDENRAMDKLYDIDILLISRFYDLFLKSKFQRYLKKLIVGIDVDVGIYPISRILVEKTLFTYDLKHHGKVLAGDDVISLIPKISEEELYPFEGFRLLFNRGIELIRAVKDFSKEGIVIEQESFNRAVSRIRRAYVDSYLIFRKKYNPNSSSRLNIFYTLGGKIPRHDNFEDTREILLEGIHDGLRVTGFNSYEDLFSSMRKRIQYPYLFRIYTAIKLQNYSALFTNPIFDAYRDLLNFLEDRCIDENWIDFKKKVLNKMNAPQPMLLKK